MKKVIFLLIIAFFLAGCTAEWYKHDTVYKTNDHMTFSWWGYKSPTDDDLQKSESEGWWGDEIPYVPAEQAFGVGKHWIGNAELMTSFRLYL